MNASRKTEIYYEAPRVCIIHGDGMEACYCTILSIIGEPQTGSHRKSNSYASVLQYAVTRARTRVQTYVHSYRAPLLH